MSSEDLLLQLKICSLNSEKTRKEGSQLAFEATVEEEDARLVRQCHYCLFFSACVLL